MIFKLRVLIEMSTFEENNIQFRPNLVFTEDVLEHGRVWRNFLVRDPHPSGKWLVSVVWCGGVGGAGGGH